MTSAVALSTAVTVFFCVCFFQGATGVPGFPGLQGEPGFQGEKVNDTFLLISWYLDINIVRM